MAVSAGTGAEQSTRMQLKPPQQVDLYAQVVPSTCPWRRRKTEPTSPQHHVRRHPPLVLTAGALEGLEQCMRTCLLDTMGALLGHGSCQAVEEGMGGSYFVKDKDGSVLGVFKPCDEEPMAPNNPKALQGRFGESSIKKGLRSGEGAAREVAAYQLDREADGLAGVPPTVLCRLSTTGRGADLRDGSYQLFVPSEGAASDYSPHTMDTNHLQAVAALDMRLLNVDRHDGNLLVGAADRGYHDHDQGTTSPGRRRTVVPIDHGCIAPADLEVGWCEWCWLDWAAIAEPIVPEVRSHILRLDPLATAAALQKLGIRAECAWNCALSTAMLRAVVSACPDATLRDVAVLMCRTDLDQPSVLEELVARVEDEAGGRGSDGFKPCGIQLQSSVQQCGPNAGKYVRTEAAGLAAIGAFENAVIHHLSLHPPTIEDGFGTLKERQDL